MTRPPIEEMLTWVTTSEIAAYALSLEEHLASATEFKIGAFKVRPYGEKAWAVFSLTPMSMHYDWRRCEPCTRDEAIAAGRRLAAGEE